jgi:LAO/AO transport system kinase
MWESLLNEISRGDIKALARGISLIENEMPGSEDILKALPASEIPVVGITGPPGAGKSTLTDQLIGQFTQEGKKVAVLCIDPSSPFHRGALLGDRVRMNNWHDNPRVYIRSLASRGAMGGLNPKIIEIADLIKAAGFDLILIETVGVGQSEIEIAALADATVVTIVLEAGDEIQTMKSGIMEIADIFVVNKSDRPGADEFVMNLKKMLAPVFSTQTDEIPVLKTMATVGTGIPELKEAIAKKLEKARSSTKRNLLLTEKAYHLIRQEKMRDIKKEDLLDAISKEGASFNLYRFVGKYKK